MTTARCSICGKALPAELPKVTRHYNLPQETLNALVELEVHDKCCTGAPERQRTKWRKRDEI